MLPMGANTNEWLLPKHIPTFIELRSVGRDKFSTPGTHQTGCSQSFAASVNDARVPARACLCIAA